MKNETPYQTAMSDLETLKARLTPAVADSATRADIPAAPSAGLFTATPNH